MNFAETNNLMLQTTGIYWAPSSSLNLIFRSATKVVEIAFQSQLSDNEIKIFPVGSQFSALKTSYSTNLVSSSFDSISIKEHGNNLEESTSIVDILFYTAGTNSYLSLVFGGIPEIVVNQDTFYQNWITLELNAFVDSFTYFEASYSSFSNILGLERLNLDVEKFNISWIPSEIKAGDYDIISGDNLGQIDGIFLNHEEVEFDLIDDQNLKVYWPHLLPEEADLIIVGSLNSHLMENVPLEQPFPRPIFDDFTSILHEDSSYTLYLKWHEPDEFFSGDYKLIINENYHGEGIPPELYQNTIITSDDEIILSGLSLGDGFTVRLQKYNDSISSFIDSDWRILEHKITTGHSFMIPERQYNLLREWATSSTDKDLVSFFQATDNHPIAIRAFLQLINNGKGFNSSSNPWFSDEGLVIFLPDEPDDPPGPSLHDRDCICKTITTSRGLHSDIGNSSPYNYENEVWLLPDVSKHISKNQTNKRRWMRTQKLGAAFYREVFTQRRRSSSRYNYFLNYDHENAGNMPESAKPSQSSSNISVSLICDAIVNGKPEKTPCLNICKTSAHLKYRYNSQHILDLKSYSNTLNSYARTFGADEVFLTVRHTNSSMSQEALIWAGMGAVEDFCESSFNTEFIGVFGSFAAQAAKYINFDSAGFSFDISELLNDQQNIQELFSAMEDVLNTNFINRQGNCDETARITQLNTQDEIYHFELGHGDEYKFTLYSKQRIGSRVLRARARTKIATDFHLLLNIGDLGYNSEKYESNRDSCCIFSRSLYLVGSHDTLYVGKNGIPFPDNPTFLADQNIVVTKYPDHISDIDNSILAGLKSLIGGYLPLDKNHLHRPLEAYIHCTPNSVSGGSSLIISNNDLIHYQCNELKEYIKLFPNPLGYNDLNIQITKEDIATKVSNVNVYNSTGQLIRSLAGNGVIKGDFTIFNIPNHSFPSSGMYFIELELQGSYNILKSVVVQK